MYRLVTLERFPNVGKNAPNGISPRRSKENRIWTVVCKTFNKIRRQSAEFSGRTHRILYALMMRTVFL
ncbi:hypothetical protein BIFADO_01531 [Bifidobacterium adolescentis L2-32]|uniref:Uncharacterized protein n=1 Tax=Bifidobacterium adolescentis L2-32 TaxID=411481 RepID=A7A6P8_BIFAD|nr:hypothetical protein BIFADO_01531 [Bifidobacterium adolescentis L2-32]